MLETTFELKMPRWLQEPETALKPMREAAARAMSVALVKHFRAKNRKEPNARGWKRSNYWSQVADSVTTRVEGNAAIAEIRKEGVRLHWLGGVVKPSPGHKALAIPADPEVYGVWPSEWNGKSKKDKPFMVWREGEKTGFLAVKGSDPEHPRVLWWLTGATHHQADETTLPDTDTLAKSVQRACKGVLRTLKGAE